MKADISRDTFQAARSIRRVVAQQGRPWVDADWNEQVAALLHRLEAMAADIFGEYAAIEDGFKIDTIAGKKFAFALQRGRYYIHGLMCENDEAVEFDRLDSLVQKSHFVYIHAWERYESSLEDPAMAEPALNGVETCGRTAVGWSVEWAEKTAIDWKTFANEQGFDALPARLRLRAKTGVKERGSGHHDMRSVNRGLENVLYRLEVHDLSGAGRFKWARNNASSLTPVSVNGSTLTCRGAGPLDPAFQPNGWVELCRGADLQRIEQPGDLRRIASVTPDTRTITTILDASGASDAAAPATLGGGDSSPSDERLFARPWAGVQSMEPTGFQPLDGGLEVSFDRDHGRRLRPGQYWLIAVRSNGGGQVYWPRGGKRPNVYQWGALGEIDSNNGVAPLEADLSTHRSTVEDAKGVPTYQRRHYYAPLAVIQFDGAGKLTPPQDLRKPRARP